MLKVTAKDFGPIVEGNIELKPLTVFVGPSNTGKSYMAMLIYALMQAIVGGRSRAYLRQFEQFELDFELSSVPVPLSSIQGENGIEVRQSIKSWIEAINTGSVRDSKMQHQFTSLPQIIQDIVNENIKTSLDSSFQRINRELQRCNGEIADLQRRSDSKSPIEIRLEQTGTYPLSLSISNTSQTNQLELEHQSFDVSQALIEIQTREIRQLQRRLLSRRNSDELEWVLYEFFSDLMSSTYHKVFGTFPRSTYYLPAARSGIAQGHKVLSSILVGQSPFAALRPMEIPTLAGVIADFMGHILTMEQSRRRRSSQRMKEVVEFLEREVVKGKIDIENLGDVPYPEIYYEPFEGQPDIRKFPFHRTSSMVSELAPVILFLKYLTMPGDLLILEEPESHLHPASQRQMARAIVRLVNAGVLVIITTHSDYFVGQLNNLLRVSRASREKRRKDGFEVADCLSSDSVSAYQFESDSFSGGSRVIPLDISPSFGIDAPDFGRVSEALYEETVSLQRIRSK